MSGSKQDDGVPVRSLDDALAFVEEGEHQISRLGIESLQAAEGDLYPYDLLVSAAASRAICLSQGFRTLMRDRNYVAAYPLVRLVLDCCLCLGAGQHVDDIHDFALHVVGGGRVSKYKSKEGDALRDVFLREKLDERFPDLGVNRMYEQCSSWIHMSASHIHSATSALSEGGDDEDEMAISVRVGGVRKLPERGHIETALSLGVTNAMLCEMIIEWHNTKVVGNRRADEEIEGKLYALKLPKITKYVASG